MVERLAGENGYIFLECGKEDGADAINGIVYENVRDWDTFEEIVDDIVDNKTIEYPTLRTVVIDTYDQLLDIAKPEVIAMHNRENPDKPVKSIKAAFGGYMAGEDKATEIVLDSLWRLKEVGVSFIIIGHVKQKEQEDITSGQKYTSLTTNMSVRDFNAIKTKLHFLGVASIDREIVQEKTGKKDNKGKDITKGVVAKESRRITFRDDSYSIDSKSRFAEICPEIPFDVDSLIKALEDAIKAEQAKSGKSFDETKAEQEAAENENNKRIAREEENKREAKKLDGAIFEITEFIKKNKTDMDKIKPVIAAVKEMGYDNPTKIDNIEAANKILEMIR